MLLKIAQDLSQEIMQMQLLSNLLIIMGINVIQRFSNPN